MAAVQYAFSGHETFPFRYPWLKKGFDAVREDPGVFLRDDHGADYDRMKLNELIDERKGAGPKQFTLGCAEKSLQKHLRLMRSADS